VSVISSFFRPIAAGLPGRLPITEKTALPQTPALRVGYRVLNNNVVRGLSSARGAVAHKVRAARAAGPWSTVTNGDIGRAATDTNGVNGDDCPLSPSKRE
jgi:hypothetical protein